MAKAKTTKAPARKAPAKRAVTKPGPEASTLETGPHPAPVEEPAKLSKEEQAIADTQHLKSRLGY